MDFESLNTRAAAEAGAFLHLRHPVTGEWLMTEKGEPIGVNVRGTESDTAQKALNRTLQASFVGDEASKGMHYTCSLIINFVNVTYKGRALEATEADKTLFFNLSGSFVDQVVAFARDRASFFGNASAA